MNKLRHGVAGLSIFVFLVLLFINVNDDLKLNYGLNDVDIQDNNGSNMNIMQRLDALTIRQGISTVTTSVQTLATPGASLLDIAGALVALGIGAVKSVLGLVLLPGQIIGIVVGFYNGSIGGWITSFVINLVMIYTAFIFLSLHLGKDV